MLDTEFKTEVQATYPLERFADAVTTYITNQSAGKVQLLVEGTID